MPCISKLKNKKGVGWPYVVALIIGLLVILALLYIIFRGKLELSSIAEAIKNMFS